MVWLGFYSLIPLYELVWMVKSTFVVVLKLPYLVLAVVRKLDLELYLVFLVVKLPYLVFAAARGLAPHLVLLVVKLLLGECWC